MVRLERGREIERVCVRVRVRADAILMRDANLNGIDDADQPRGSVIYLCAINSKRLVPPSFTIGNNNNGYFIVVNKACGCNNRKCETASEATQQQKKTKVTKEFCGMPFF